MAAISISGVHKTYEDSGREKNRKAALLDVSLSIRDREFFTLLGPSGCGKTTLLRSIAGFFGIDSGSIAIGDRTVSDPSTGTLVPPEHRDLGMVFQSYAVWPHMTVAENVGYPLKIRKVAAARIGARVDSALRQVQLTGLAGRYPAQLSGGQQQRVALARSLVMEPAALLLDEPLSNLDARLRAEMRFELKELQQRLGLTIVYVTHDQEEALAMSDRIAVMSEGRLVQLGTPQEIHRQPASEFVARFLGRNSIITGPVNGPALDSPGGRITVAAGSGLITADAREPERLPPGSDAIVSIRYTAAKILESGAPGALPATIRVSTFMGDYWLHEVELSDGQVVIARGETDEPSYERGRAVALQISRAHVFPAEFR